MEGNMKHTGNSLLLASVILLYVGISSLSSCGTQSHLKYLQTNRDSIVTQLTLPKEKQFTPNIIKNEVKRDTVKTIEFEGKQFIMMKNAIIDGEEMITEELQAAVVTARFRHLAERNGKVDLEFQIIVPAKMMDSDWQLRYEPTMYVLDDSVKLDRVFITGKDYRKKQLRGYEQYEKFLSKIITDSNEFIKIGRLELFISRNFPEIYAFKTDSTFVSDEEFAGFMGVTQREAIEHYTDRLKIKMNDRRKARRGKMYSRYIKAPIVTEHLRLDTVVVDLNGNYVYNYIQELDTRGKKKLKKVDIVVGGEIYQQGEKIFDIPRTEPLTFYISSLSAFVDGTERYITKIIERRATANQNYNIDFAVGKWDVNPDLGDNRSSIKDIKEQLQFILSNEKFDLDSVVVVASASPEGSVAANGTLSKRRSESISDYFNRFMKHQIDSLNAQDGFSMVIGEDMSSTIVQNKVKRQPVQFKSRFVAENWEGLNRLVEVDTVLTITDKEDYYALCDVKDLDKREAQMRNEKWYAHMKQNLYPRLRTVQFQFILHRKGMVKDTLHTTEIDSVYMQGVQAIRDRDYELAANLLGPYNDYNAAIAYCALDRNHSALQILEKCEKTDQVNYMLAVIYSRFGDDEKAVKSYLTACKQNPMYVHRGNLDPEISVLIKKYGLNKQDDDDLIY